MCDIPVTKDELEFEILFARAEPPYGLDKFHVHVWWEFERHELQSP